MRAAPPARLAFARGAAPWFFGLGLRAVFAAEVVAPPVNLPAVTVEGDRFERPRGDIAESHAVLGGAMLEAQVAADTFGVLDRVANTTLGFAHDTPFSIRGVGNDSVTPGLLGRVAPVAGLYHNGVAATPTYADYFLPTLWDVATVSVFRGPISTSHGFNALIGGVFLRYAEPTFSAEGRLRASAAGFGTYEVAVMENTPLVDDHLAVRLAAEHRGSDGAVRNVTRRTDDWTRTAQDHLRAQFRWRPRGDDTLRVDLLLRQEHSGSANAADGRALGPAGSLFDRLADADADTSAHANNSLAALTVRATFSSGASLESVTAWQTMTTADVFDLDRTAVPLAAGSAGLSERALSEELQWRRRFGPVDLLVGGYGERAAHHQRYATFLNIPGLPATGSNHTQIDSHTLAVFAQTIWHVAPAITAEAGLRVHRATREVTIDNRNDGYGIPTRGRSTDEVLSPRASVTWTPRAGTQLGVLVSHGFRGGGISSALVLASTRAYGPEHAWNYEIFLRRETVDGRFWAQVNAYAMDWREQQVSVTPPGGVPGLDDVVFNAGRSRLHGLEAEAGWRVAERWSAFASLGHQATKFVTFVNGGANYSGDPFPNAPRWNASLGGGYGIDDARPGFYGGATLTWRAPTYSIIGLRDFSALESRTLLSARLGWRWKNGASIYVFGENLLDDDFAYTRIDWRVFGSPSPVGHVSQPRTFGVGVELAW